jgi:hypothetical protein
MKRILKGRDCEHDHTWCHPNRRLRQRPRAGRRAACSGAVSWPDMSRRRPADRPADRPERPKDGCAQSQTLQCCGRSTVLRAAGLPFSPLWRYSRPHLSGSARYCWILSQYRVQAMVQGKDSAMVWFGAPSHCGRSEAALARLCVPRARSRSAAQTH